MSTPQWAVVWVESGEARLTSRDGRTWPLRAGSIFQRLPGAVHDVVRLTPTSWWYLALPAACHDAARAVGLPNIDLPAFTIRPPPGLAQRFRRAATALRDAPGNRLGPLLAELFSLAMDLHAAAAPAGPHTTAIERATALLAADPLRPWSTAGLARASGIGTHTFRRAFAAAHGCGPATYRLRLRLERAQELLATTGLRIPEVATHCGWSDPLQFSACFRRRIGLPPRSWRLARR